MQQFLRVAILICKNFCVLINMVEALVNTTWFISYIWLHSFIEKKYLATMSLNNSFTSSDYNFHYKIVLKVYYTVLFKVKFSGKTKKN